MAQGSSTYVSPAAHRLLGFDPTAFLGHDPLDLVHPDDRELAAIALAGTKARPGVAPLLELRALHADGTTHRLECSANNLLDDPEVAGIVINARDVTNRRVVAERYDDGVIAVDTHHRAIDCERRTRCHHAH